MATLWIREFRETGISSQRAQDAFNISVSDAQIPVEPGVDQTPVTFSASTQSAAFADTTNYIAIIASAKFHYVVGDSPTATTNALPVPADTLLFLAVPAGRKIAVIEAA